MKPIEIVVLARLLKGPSTSSELAKELHLTPGRISQVMKELLAGGWVEIRREKKRKRIRLSNAEHVNAFRELYLSYPGTKFEELLAHGRFDVLTALLGRGLEVKEIVRLTGLSFPSVRNHLRALAAVGAVTKVKRAYQLNRSFQKLEGFLTAYWRVHNRHLVNSVSGQAAILWERGPEFIVRMPAGEKPPQDWQPAGITALGNAGVRLFTEFAEFFFSPYVKANPWHVPAQLLLAHPGDARYAVYALLYLEKIKLADAAVKEAAAYYGATDAVGALLKFRLTREPVEGCALPSWEEFVKMAAEYGVRIVINFTAEDIRARLAEIGQKLHGTVTVYLIGGAAMAMNGLKDATRDVDLVVPSTAQFKSLIKTLAALGYKSIGPPPVPAMGSSGIFEDGGGFRVDIYCQRVLKGLIFTKSMMERAKKFAGFGKLQVFLASNEDIFLFKSVTERPRDLDDMLSLARVGLDWEGIYREAEKQSEISGTIWPAFLVVKLEELKDVKGVTAPNLARLRGLAEKLTLQWLVAQKIEQGLKTADEIARELNLPRKWIERTLKMLKP